jgi:predicted transcriptional regulator
VSDVEIKAKLDELIRRWDYARLFIAKQSRT